MIGFLYSLPNLAIATLFGSSVGLLFVAAPLLRARMFGHLGDSHSETARTTMTAITGFLGVVLAFSLVQAQGNLRNVEKTIAAEAMQLNQLDRLLLSYGDPDMAAIRQIVQAYGESIVRDEWPNLAQRGHSARTADLFYTLSRQIAGLRPAPGQGTVIYADLIKVIDQLAESREDRLGEAELALPPIYWQVIGSLMVMLVAFSAFVEPQRAISLGGLGAALALLIALVFIFDRPFLGQVAATADPITRALAVMVAR